MASEFIALIQGLKALKEIGQAISDKEKASAVVSAITNLQSDLLTAQNIALDGQQERGRLADENRALKETIARFADWEAIRRAYALREVGQGIYLYVFVGADHPKHFACPHCFERRERSILQYSPRASAYLCPSCQITFSPYAAGRLIQPAEVD